MLNNSTENLFGGINKIIAEKYAKMHIKESDSVSDLDQTPKEGETQLDETGCADKKIEESTEIVQESQDYNTFLKREDFESKLNELGLKAEHNGKDHDEVKDNSGDLKGWWNGHTGVGYLRKDCCKPVTESIDGQQEQATHTESGDLTSDESLKIAIQTAANRAKESGTHYHDEIIRELGSLGMDPIRHATHAKLDNAVSSMTNGKYTCHSDFGNDHVAGQLKEDVTLETPVVESVLIPTDKLEESREKGFQFFDKDIAVLHAFHRGESAKSENIKTDGKTLDGNWPSGKSIATRSENGDVTFKRPTCNSDEDCKRVYHSTIKKLEESHLTPELTDKIGEYVNKLNPKMSEFQDKYGDSAESVMYGTATKLAKNDLGIKD